MDILIIKLGAMGDVLRTTSILKGLKEMYKESSIDWVTKKESFDLLKNNQYIDNIFIIGDNLNELKNRTYDLIINLDEEKEACELATKLNKKKLIGIHLEDGECIYTDDSAEWFDMGLISRFGKEKADGLKKLNKRTYQGIISSMLNIKFSELILNLDKENISFANKFFIKNKLEKNDLIIGFNTGAGKRWPMKSLSVEKTAALANMLIKKLNAKVILFGGPAEKERNKKILEKSSGLIDAGCNNPLLQFAALVDLCKIIVCSDSLALHIAIALKKKVVAFFGPTSAAEIELYGRGKKISANIDCITCYKRDCDKKPNCMDLIKIDKIFDVVRGLV